MARETKCIYCEVKDAEQKVRVGKRYAHDHCKKEKDIENKEWSDLYEYIKNLTGCLQVPPRNVKRLHEIKKKYNITYGLVLDGFKIAEKKIVWFMNNVRNGGNSAEDINAYITVMLNSGLNEAVKRFEKKKQIEDNRKAMESSFDPEFAERKIDYRRQDSHTNDISSFLEG